MFYCLVLQAGWLIYRVRAELKDSIPGSTASEGQTNDKPDPWWSEYVDEYRRIDQSELPSDTVFGVSFDTYTIEVQRYLRYLQGKVEALGGKVVRARLSSDNGIEGAVESAKVVLGLPKEYRFLAVINASGNGARDLVKDENLYPIRGQIVKVQGVADYCTTRLGHHKNDRTGVMPRPGENITVIGVTVEPDIGNTEVDPKMIPQLLNAAKPFCPELLNKQGEFTVIETGVGLRPGRKGGARVEMEHINDLTIVHAYGVAGAGYQNSIGLSRKILRLLQNHPS